jgi:hypothetical protein
VRIRAEGRGASCFPHDPLLDQFWQLAECIMVEGGEDARLERKQRQLLRESGFTDIRASASHDFYDAPDATSRFSHYWAEVFLAQHREKILDTLIDFLLKQWLSTFLRFCGSA